MREVYEAQDAYWKAREGSVEQKRALAAHERYQAMLWREAWAVVEGVRMRQKHTA